MSINLSTNKGSKAEILPQRGGLLSKLFLMTPKGVHCDVLWRPETFNPTESGWPGGGCPILFPFAGRTFLNQTTPLRYALDGTEYHMPLHGFAYALPWTVVNRETDQSIHLRLQDTAATREFFPFKFLVDVHWTLNPHDLTLKLTVTNPATGSDTLPFALGLHPHLSTPCSRGGVRTRTFLKTYANTAIRVMPNGSAGKAEAFQEGDLPIDTASLTNLILTAQLKNAASLRNKESKVEIKQTWSDEFKYLVLWRQGEEPFHCVEPWMGLPDSVYNGEGLLKLARGASKTLTWTLSVNDIED